MPQIQAARSSRHARFPIVRPLTLTVMLALAACSNQLAGGSRASGAPGSNLTPEQSAETMLKVADDTRAGGDLGSAVGLYRRAHELALRDPVPLARAGETLAQLQAYTEAAEAYQAALALAPADGDLHRGLGNVLLALGKPQLALAHLEIAAAKNPGDARVQNALGVAHDLSGRHDLAQQDYRRGLSLAPDQLSLRNNLGLSQALGGDYNGAIATLSDLVSRPGASARNRQNLALVYGLAGDTTRAASVARSDLDEGAVRNNLTYYTLLRNLDDVGRTAAILGADVRAARAAAAPSSMVKDPTIADAPPATPLEPVTSKALPTQAFGSKTAKTPAADAAPKPLERATRPPESSAVPSNSEMPLNSGSVPAVEPAPQSISNPKAASVTAETAAPTQVASTASIAMAPVQIAMAPIWSKGDRGKPSEPARKLATKDEALPQLVPTAAPSGLSAGASATVEHKAPAVAGKRIAVQAGAFQSEANANKLTKQLAAKGVGGLTVIHDRDRQGRDWYVVRAGDFATSEAAEAVAQSIRNTGKSGALVVRISAPAADSDVAAARD